jgi:hypothetical protein
MRDLIAGVAVALAAGLMGGAAMRPDLNTGGDLPAPQLFTRAEAAQSDMALAAYQGRAPDYVYGTDFKRQTVSYASVSPIHEEAYVPPEPARSASDAADDAVLHAGAGDAPSPVSIPSIDGGQPYAAAPTAETEVG